MKIDICCDMGESFGSFRVGIDDEVVKFISSANIACGFHGGDPMVIDKTVKISKEHHVAVGAHPGFPDLLGFGRRNMDLTQQEINNYVIYQIGALKVFAEVNGIALQHVKAHGALYNMAAVNETVALSVAEAIASVDPNLICVGMANTAMQRAAEKVGLRFACEVFADRNINPDGTLVSRKLPNAMIYDHEVACARVLRMIKEGVVEAIDGSLLPVRVDTICVHGDNLEAVKFAQTIKTALEENGVEVTPMGTFL
ncbi:LamB/YcsF family protein [Biomaibacter acetigenes]|uniref:5-oxoprolinase subunit A n=1 Tax=Biomaibacter acetigenes TaxID=2316383 RepID=A0A3G2R345_9FIRM|nr:5-oxoprolinase subunit PxpA [Biomaibacter acetigenes]AYO29538.1 LamB/YcsF family protein [Biomaibacter acetigenes]